MAAYENKPIWPGWETVGLIGRGSFGAVYEIERTIGKITEKSALKVITIPKESSEINELSLKGYDKESISERFRGLKESIEDEYAMMAKLKGCANVVYCDDIQAIQHDDGMSWDIFIRMELLTPLLEYRNGSMDEREIIRLGKEICNALVMCQKYNIVHRDIKPQNIFVSKDGTFKLGDFGIAKAVEHTTSGTMTGTYDYMAPEVEMHRPYNRTVDIYSLGMVLYWYLNEKRLPFLPLPPVKILWKDETSAKDRRLRGDALPAPAHGNEELKRIVLKACAFDPKDRYQSAQEMLTDLTKLGGASMDIPFMPVDSDAEKNEGSAQDRFGDSNTEKETEGTVGSFGKENWTKKDVDPTEYGKTVGVFDNPPQPKPEPAPKPNKWPAILAAVATLVLIAAGLYFLPGWEPATCSSPETHKLLMITRGEALGHDWGKPTYTWAKDNGSVTAKRVCQNDKSHIETETAQTTSEVTSAATCTSKGKTTYTAVFSNTAFARQKKTVENIVALGHSWKEATYTSPKTCERCGAQEGEAVPIPTTALPCTPLFEPRIGYAWYTVVKYRIEDIAADLVCTISANKDLTEFYLDTEYYGDKQETRSLYDGKQYIIKYDLTGYMGGDTPAILDIAREQNTWLPIYTTADLPCSPNYEARADYAWYTVVKYRIEDIAADLVCTISANKDLTEFYLDTEYYGDKQETRSLYDGKQYIIKYDLTGYMGGDTPAILDIAREQNIWLPISTATLPCTPLFEPRTGYTWYTVVDYRIEEIKAELICTVSANKDLTEFYLDTYFYGSKQETRSVYDGEQYIIKYDLTGFMGGDAPIILDLARKQNIWLPIVE